MKPAFWTEGSIVFYDALVLRNQHAGYDTEKHVRLVNNKIKGVNYWLATNRLDLSGKQIAAAYKLRRKIDNFFAWWKRRLKIYHLIARTEQSRLIVQMLTGLITCLLEICGHEQHNEKVSIGRVRELHL